MSVATYTKSGTKATVAAKLNKDVFDVSVTNNDLLKRAYVAYLANGRENLAVTKTRGLVRGGGKKPWKQKGTGRARFGSSRVPIWRGGGITFGPTGIENYSHKLPVNSKRLATRQALTVANKAGKIKVIESFEAKEGKTATIARLLNKIDATGNVLVVLSTKDAAITRAAQNIPNVKLIEAKYLHVYDILNADSTVIDQKALKTVEDWLTSPKQAKAGAKDE